jgi:asparagine synthase (glutamine-hydrolysing)
MCGIAGIISFDEGVVPTSSQLEAMCNSMIHRGPDDVGIDISGQVGMGMRRLSIIDLVGGHQPIYNEDRSVRVIFNGEIYNYRELRQDLERCGHRFSTESDTEVIVHLWEEKGPEFADMLNGMFAIALHDLRQRRFILARDHLGIKPLFYSLDARRLVFGSEVKAVLASGLVSRALDLDALGQFIAWEYVPGEGTLLASVRKLEPGHLLELDLETTQSRLRSYWDVPLNGHLNPSNPRSDTDWEDLVDQTIRTAVRRQLVSDVALGAFLS